MHTKKTIAIIGMGEMGKTIAAALSKGNERVLLVDKNFEVAETVSADLLMANKRYDVEAVSCSHDAAWEADIIILAVACSELEVVANYIKDVSTQKIIIAVSDSFKEDTAAASETLLQLLPNCKIARVIKINNKGMECILKNKDEDAAGTLHELFSIINSGTSIAD
jgi:predicted dinucleotide-binding enzyme